MTQQAYVVLRQDTKRSKYGNLIVEITLVGTKDRQEYKTYIDPSFRNYRNWQHIVSNPHHGFVLTGCRKKSPELISADSKPIIAWESEDPEEIYNELLDVWQN